MKAEKRETFTNGFEYYYPKVKLLKSSGLEVSEIAGRTCYNSFEKSEHDFIKDFKNSIENDSLDLSKVEIENSGLLDDLSWAYFHHSILEHTVLQFYIEGTSRGVLQEFARHRIASPSVQSTRYTMADILVAFVVFRDDIDKFIQTILDLEMFVVADKSFQILEAKSIHEKLSLYFNKGQLSFNTNEFKFVDNKKEPFEEILSKSQKEFYENNLGKIENEELYRELMKLPKKRNVGDKFKFIVTDNWLVNIVWTINLRSFRNFMTLRDSGSAWFLIRALAEKLKENTPKKYLRLIDKKVFNESKKGEEND